MRQPGAKWIREGKEALPTVTGSTVLKSALVIAILFGGVLLAVGVRAYNKIVPTISGSTTSPSPLRTPRSLLRSTDAHALPQKGPTEAEVITILPTGFQPTEISRPTGLFLLAVENRSGLKTIELRLDRQSGNRFYDVRVHHGRAYWRQGLDLPPGRYTLSEATHPEWRCSIDIGSK